MLGTPERLAASWRWAVIALAGSGLCALQAATPAGSAASASSSSASQSVASEITFDIQEFRVLGNTLLPVRAIESAVYPFLGPGKSIKVVQQARDALAALYRKAGYGTVLVEIPEQAVDSGIVRLQVVEGRLQHLQISGARYYSEPEIIEQLPALKPGEVPNLPDLQLELGRLASEARDRQITPVLQAGSEPGTVAVNLKVQDRLPLHISLQLDDNHTIDTTPLRLTGIVSYENMFQRAETLSVQYQTAPAATKEVQLLAVTYIGRTLIPDLTWAAYAIRSNSDVATVGTLSVFGNGKIFGGRLNFALTATPRWSDAFSLGVDYKDFTQQVNLASSSSQTPIHYLIWSAQYSGSAHLPSLDFTTSLAANFSIQGLSASDTEFEFSRYGARADFFYLRGSDQLTYRFLHNSSVRLRLGYQYSEAPLVTNEQFSMGGQDSVRGYLLAETLDDTGVTESIELAPPLLKWGPTSNLLFAFYDAGQGGIQQPLPAQTSHINLAGTGFGLRSSWLPGLESSLDGAYALHDGPVTRRGDKRVDFYVRYSY